MTGYCKPLTASPGNSATKQKNPQKTQPSRTVVLSMKKIILWDQASFYIGVWILVWETNLGSPYCTWIFYSGAFVLCEHASSKEKALELWSQWGRMLCWTWHLQTRKKWLRMWSLRQPLLHYEVVKFRILGDGNKAYSRMVHSDVLWLTMTTPKHK